MIPKSAEKYIHYQEKDIILLHGDCLEILPLLEPESVDLVLTDPPYGTTSLDWDGTEFLDTIWKYINKLCKTNAIMTSSQPFTTDLINSNRINYLYGWVWDKGLSGNIFLKKYQPMKIHEDINVFNCGSPRYHPVKTRQLKRKLRNNGMNDSAFGTFKQYEGGITDELNPKSILYFPNTDRKKIKHPTQKPIELFNYLLTTYSLSDSTILDPFLGSGTTAVAAKRLGRKCIGIELEKKYLDIAVERLRQEILL